MLGKGGASLTWAKVARELKIRKEDLLRRHEYAARTVPPARVMHQVRLENRTLNFILATFPGKDIDDRCGGGRPGVHEGARIRDPEGTKRHRLDPRRL